MKKLIKLLTVILSIIMLTAVLPACSILGNDNVEDKEPEAIEPEIKTQTITIYNGDESTTYTATYGDIVEIDVVNKKGYYFLGAYDAQEGGTKYFDFRGNSTVVWGAGLPSTYYIRHEDVSNFTFDSGVKYYEEPQNMHAGVDINVKFEFNDELINAIKANLDTKLKIEVSLEVACKKSWEFYKIAVQNLSSGGERLVLGEKIQLTANEYKALKYSVEMDADLFQKGYLYIFLDAKDGIDIADTPYYYKNISVKITFN